MQILRRKNPNLEGATGERDSFAFNYQSIFFVSFNSSSDLNNLKIKEFFAQG